MKKFNRDLLPNPSDYYQNQGIKLQGLGEWKSALCIFHKDTKPSLRINIRFGGFRCMTCGEHGGDVLAFHQKRHRLNFTQAAKELGAWIC